jgi:hypothetical protein
MIVKIETKDRAPSPHPLPDGERESCGATANSNPSPQWGEGVMHVWRMTGEGEHETVALIEKDQTCH